MRSNTTKIKCFTFYFQRRGPAENQQGPRCSYPPGLGGGERLWGGVGTSEGEAGTSPQPPGPVYERSLGSSRGAAGDTGGAGRDSGWPWGFQEVGPLEPGPFGSLGVSGAAAEAGLVWASSDGQPGLCGHGLREGARWRHAARAAPLPGMQIWVDRVGSRALGAGGQKKRIRAGQLALSTGLLPMPCGPCAPVRGLLPSAGEEGTEITG